MDIKIKEQMVNDKNRAIKKNNNKYLTIFIIIFLSGYIFFFSSSFWMPMEYKGVNITEPGTVIEANDREVTLISWTYSKEQKIMEVIIEINNTSIDGINRYKWSAVDRNKGPFETKVIEETDDFVVLHIVDVPRRWSEASLRMDIKSKDQIKVDEFTSIRFYASKKTIKPQKYIESKNLTQYKREAIVDKIELYKEAIEKIDEEIREERRLINEAEKTLLKLNADKKYQTMEETSSTDEKITRVESEISSAEDRIDAKKEEQAEYKEKINKQKEHLKVFGGSND